MDQSKKHIKEKLLKKEILETHGSYDLCGFVYYVSLIFCRLLIHALACNSCEQEIFNIRKQDAEVFVNAALLKHLCFDSSDMCQFVSIISDMCQFVSIIAHYPSGTH